MSIYRKNIRRGISLAVIAGVFALGVGGSAHATQLHNDVVALACKEVKLSAVSKVQTCTDVVLTGAIKTQP